MCRSRTTGAAILAILVFILGYAASARGFGGGDFTIGGKNSGAARMVSLEEVYQDALHKEEGEGDLAGAIEGYRNVVESYRRLTAEAGKARSIGAQATLHLAAALEKSGRKGEAIGHYVAVADEFSGTPEADQARKKLQELGVEIAGDDSAQRVIRAKLQKRLETEIVGAQVFSALLDQLRKSMGINIVTDDTCASALAPGDQNALTFNVKDLTVEEALTLACKAKGLEWTIYSGAVYIASPAKIEGISPKSPYEKELALVEQKVEIARRALAHAQVALDRGGLSVAELDEVRLKLIAAEREKLEVQRRLEAERAKVSRTFAFSAPGGPVRIMPSAFSVSVDDLFNALYNGEATLPQVTSNIAEYLGDGRLSAAAAQTVRQMLDDFAATMEQEKEKIESAGKAVDNREIMKALLEQMGYPTKLAAKGTAPAAPSTRGKTYTMPELQERQAEAAAEEMKARGYTVVTLYRRGLPNFTGPQAVNLYKSETAYIPEGTSTAEFLEKNPEFDMVCEFNEHTSPARFRPGIYLRLNKGRRAALLSEYTTPETLPDTVQYAEPAELAEGPADRPVLLDEAGYILVAPGRETADRAFTKVFWSDLIMPTGFQGAGKFVVAKGVSGEQYFVRFWPHPASREAQALYVAFAKLPFKEKTKAEIEASRTARREATIEQIRTERQKAIQDRERRRGGSVGGHTETPVEVKSQE